MSKNLQERTKVSRLILEKKHRERDLAEGKVRVAETIYRNLESLYQGTDLEVRLMAIYGNRDFGFSEPEWIGTTTVGLSTIDAYRKGEGIHSEDPVWKKIYDLRYSINPLFDKAGKARLKSKLYELMSKMRSRTVTEEEYNFILNNSVRRIRREYAKRDS